MTVSSVPLTATETNTCREHCGTRAPLAADAAAAAHGAAQHSPTQQAHWCPRRLFPGHREGKNTFPGLTQVIQRVTVLPEQLHSSWADFISRARLSPDLALSNAGRHLPKAPRFLPGRLWEEQQVNSVVPTQETHRDGARWSHHSCGDQASRACTAHPERSQALGWLRPPAQLITHRQGFWLLWPQHLAPNPRGHPKTLSPKGEARDPTPLISSETRARLVTTNC